MRWLCIKDKNTKEEPIHVLGLTKTILPGLIGDSINTSALLDLLLL